MGTGWLSFKIYFLETAWVSWEVFAEWKVDIFGQFCIFQSQNVCIEAVIFGQYSELQFHQ